MNTNGHEVELAGLVWTVERVRWDQPTLFSPVRYGVPGWNWLRFFVYTFGRVDFEPADGCRMPIGNTEDRQPAVYRHDVELGSFLRWHFC